MQVIPCSKINQIIKVLGVLSAEQTTKEFQDKFRSQITKYHPSLTLCKLNLGLQQELPEIIKFEVKRLSAFACEL